MIGQLKTMEVAPRLSPAQWLLGILITALAYYVGGRLGLLLAIPPGYATAVWPASGVALAAVLLRGYPVVAGVWIGSFAINLPTSLGPDGVLQYPELLPPILIGAGAALQAAVGGFLIRRLVGYRNLLDQELDIVPLLMIGGPVACLISSSCGVGLLHWRGLIPSESLLFNWWTWWVGDSIGVLIFTPLVLVWSLRPRARWLSRQLAVTLPLITLFSAVVWLFVYTSGREQARMQTQFEGWSRAVQAQINHALQQKFDALAALQAFYASSAEVTPAEFDAFAGRLLDRHRGLLGIAWNQWQRDGGKARLVVRHMVPAESNRAVIGYDILSEAARAAAVRHALDSGQAVATPPLQLVQKPEAATGVLLLAPVYRSGTPNDTTEQRRQNVLGFVAMAFDAAQLIPLARGAGTGGAVELKVEDISGEVPNLLYQSPGMSLPIGMQQVYEMAVGHRTWKLSFALPEQYLVSHRSWEVWALLAGGMLFTGLLGMFLLVAVGRGARIAHLVEERTAQLQEVNRSLAREAARSERLETEARGRADQLTATNRELEQFAFVVSHDLQAPLRNIASFAQLLEKRHAAVLPPQAREYLGEMRGGVGDMSRMIQDLLQLSRVNPSRANMTRIRSSEVLDAALNNLRSDLEGRSAKVESAELPEVFGDAGLLTQVFQNLIGNAIKFQQPGVTPQVKIDAELVRGEWHFAVRDNGIGIAEKNLGRLFQIFKRLHGPEEFPGSGIGLALCKKIISLHGGRIWVESRPGEGSTFWFALPLQGPTPAASTYPRPPSAQ